MAMRWRILSQRPTERLTPSGSFESIVVVNFETGKGSPGVVNIPARLYTPEYVQEQVEAAAKTIIAIEDMQG